MSSTVITAGREAIAFALPGRNAPVVLLQPHAAREIARLLNLAAEQTDVIRRRGDRASVGPRIHVFTNGS